MADKQLSALTAASALADADLFYVSQGGNSRKATGTQLKTYAASSFAGWTDATPNGTGSVAGGTYSVYTPTFTSGTNKGLELEAIFKKTAAATSCVLGVSDSGGEAVRIVYQGDGNKLYYRGSGAGTSVGATGSTDTRTGLCRLTMRLSIASSSDLKVDGSIDDQRLPTSNSQAISANLTNTLTLFTNDNEANVEVVGFRYRWTS